jgi:hypothetical protein
MLPFNTVIDVSLPKVGICRTFKKTQFLPELLTDMPQFCSHPIQFTSESETERIRSQSANSFNTPDGPEEVPKVLREAPQVPEEVP